MAKSVTTQYRLTTERAIQNIGKLNESIKAYNREVKATTRSQELLKKQSADLRTNFRQLNTSATRLVETFKKKAAEIRSATREIEKFNKSTDNAKKKQKELQQVFKQDRLIARTYLRQQLARIDTEDKLKIQSEDKELQRRQRLDRKIAQQHLRSQLAAQDALDRTKIKNEEKELQRRTRLDRRIAQNHLRSELARMDAVRRAEERQAAQIIRIQQRRDRQIATGYLRDELKKLEGNVDTTTHSVERLGLALRVAAGVIIARAVSELANQFRVAARDAGELSKRIAEVQTVSLEYRNGIVETVRNTRDWNIELRALSRNFGIDVLETTEALYEALSNQVVEAGGATNFMAQEMKLAITTVSSLDEAVDATSTVLNAFRKDVSETARVNAVLFRAVDLGRFRLNELGSQFGRVSVLSNELGISFEEQAGAIALLTRLGLKADVAQTLLTNVQLKLIKPTEQMTELFNRWGVTSGQAAIQTFGFTGVVRRLAEEVQRAADPASELGDIFQDLRAITGAQGLVSNFDELEKTIKDVSTATEFYNKAFDLTLNSLGRKADIELQKIRQEFLSLGEAALRVGLQIADFAGGADRAVRFVGRGIQIYTSYRLALLAVNTAMAIHTRLTVQSTVATQANIAAKQGARAATIGLAVAQGTATLGLTALVAVLSEATIGAELMQAQFESTLITLRSNLIEESRKSLERLQQQIAETTQTQLEANNTTFRSYFLLVANLRAQNTALSEDFRKKFKTIKEAMADGLKVSTDTIEERLKGVADKIRDIRKVADDLRKDAGRKALDEADRRFAFDIRDLEGKDAVEAIDAKRRELEGAAEDALRAGDFELAKDLTSRAETFADEVERRLDDMVKAARDAAVEIRAHLDTAGGVGFGVKAGGRAVGVRRRVRSRPGEAVVGVDVKREIVDLEAIAGIEARLAKFEEERRKSVEARLELERTIAGEKEKEARRLEAEVKAREKSFEIFKRLVAEIDAFDPSGPDAAARFGGLVAGAERAGAGAGLTPAEQLQFLRQAFAQRTLLAREAATAAAKAQLDIEKKALDEGTRLVAEAVKKRQALLNTEAEQTEAFAIANIEAAARLRNEFQRGGLLGIGEITPFAPGDKATETARNAQIQKTKEAVDEFEKLNNKLLETRRNGGNTAEVIKQIAAAQERLVASLNDLNKAGGLTRAGLGPGGAGVARNAAGEILFEAVPGRPEESLSDLVRRTQEALAKLAGTRRDVAISAEEVRRVQEQMEKLRIASERIPEEIRKQAEAAANAGEVTVTAQEAIQKVLDGTLERLEAVRQAHIDIIELQRREREAIEAAGPVIPRAHGGFVGMGTDRHLVALSGGETIMTRMATRQYAPLLRALNGAAPAFRAQGGQVSNNYGDIHIHPSSTTSSGAIIEIAQGLKRLHRRGFL